MIYGGLIDNAEATKGGFRFNVYLWQADDNVVVLDYYGKGYRIMDGLAHLPAYQTRKGSFPNHYLPRPWAEALVDALLEDAELRQRFSTEYPLMSREYLVENLMFAQRNLKRDFPKLAAQRGLLET